MTMPAQEAFEWFEDGAIVAGMRGAFPPEVALKTCDILLDEDIDCFEFTMNSEKPIAAMQAVKERFKDEVCVGMGTVLDIETAQKVIDAGADFIVSPVLQSDIVKHLVEKDILICPGVMTPSEAVQAWALNVKLLKLFPIGALGIDYFKALYAPLNHIKFMCNGAMNDKNAREFVQAGAVAAGMGSWLTGDGTWTETRLRSRAKVLVNSVASAQSFVTSS